MIAAAMPKPQSRARHGGAIETSPNPRNGEVSKAALQPKWPANPPIVRSGTALAVNYLTYGGAALSAGGTGRGGARNRAGRESLALSAAHVANLTAATAHADAIGLPFTRMVTIHWEAAGVPLAGIAKATGRFTDLMTRALARHGSRTTWIWIHENCGPKGGHCHLLAHVPADLVLVLTKLHRGWLRRITGMPYRKRVIRSDPIGGRLGLEIGNPELHAVNLESALGYVLKGANSAAVARFGLVVVKPGGRVIGKRCGTSQNIGAKSRSLRS